MGSYTLADAITHAYRLLSDEADLADEQHVTDTEFAAFLREAAVRYSIDRPLTRVEDLVADGTTTLALPAGFVNGYSQILSVEAPVGSLIAEGTAALTQTPTGLSVAWLTGYQPAASSTVRIAYTTPRVWAEVAADTTIADLDFYAVVALGASIAADAVAAKFASTHEPILNADVAAYRSKAEEWQSIAKRLATRYKDHLKVAGGMAVGTVLNGASDYASWSPRMTTGHRFIHHRR